MARPGGKARDRHDRDRVAATLKALGDPARLRILEFLWSPDSEALRTEDGVCGQDLQAVLGLAQPTVSYHMKLLTQAGLVRVDRRGKWAYYECVDDGLDGVLAYLGAYWSLPAGGAR